MGADTSSIVAALGSVIGYLGAEVAEFAIFERLLWPERFYNVPSFGNIVLTIFLNPLGGPVHKAALKALDEFRETGLYGGRQQGHMLGTAFFKDLKKKYRLHNYTGKDLDAEVRNGLWVPVIQRLRRHQEKPTISSTNGHDSEKGKVDNTPQRTYQRVQHLTLRPIDPAHNSHDRAAPIRTLSEDNVKPIAFIFVLAGEVTTLVCAFLIGYLEHYYWFTGYLCIPLVLRLIALCVSVQREPLAGSQLAANVQTADEQTVLIEVSDYDYGFPLIEGPEHLVRSFFRHWGHPIRHRRQDRIREVAGILLVFAFVFVFPAGLLIMLWSSPTAQLIWILYETYTVFAMHVNRIGGLSDPGGIHDQMAKSLAKDGVVRLRSAAGSTIEATLDSYVVERIADGRKKVLEIAQEHEKRMARLAGMKDGLIHVKESKTV